MAINNAPIARSKYSPYFLNYGFHPCVIPDVLLEDDSHRNYHRNVREFMVQMQNDWQSVRLLHNTVTDMAEDQANRHRSSYTFNVGDKVLVSMNPIVREQLIPGFEGKLAPKAAGPYIITHQITPNSFRLQL